MEREENASASVCASVLVMAGGGGEEGRLMRMKSSERGEPGTALLAALTKDPENSPELARLHTISSSEAESSAQRLDWDRTSVGEESDCAIETGSGGKEGRPGREEGRKA